MIALPIVVALIYLAFTEEERLWYASVATVIGGCWLYSVAYALLS